MKVDNLQVAAVVFALGVIVLCCALVGKLPAAGHIKNRTAQLDENKIQIFLSLKKQKGF